LRPEENMAFRDAEKFASLQVSMATWAHVNNCKLLFSYNKWTK